MTVDDATTVRTPVRLPVGPLLELVRHRYGPGSRREVAGRLGVDRATVDRAKRTGLSELQADRWACAVGEHPAFVWGDDWWSLCAAPDEPAAGR